MVKVNPYFHFDGNAEEAMNFYKSVFGGEFAMQMRFKDVPGFQGDAGEGDKFMHLALPLSKDNVLMASDVPEEMKKNATYTVGNNLDLSISTESKEEADRIFAGLSAGGTIELAMTDQFWGDYFGMLKDKYGMSWMVSFSKQHK